MASLIFQGLQDDNEQVQIANSGYRSSFSVIIGPNCDAVQNPGCGQEFASTFSVTSIAKIAAVNDPPFITTCPQAFLQATGDVQLSGLEVKDGIVTWSNPFGQCQKVNLFPSTSSPIIGPIPLPFSFVKPYLGGPAYCQTDSPTQIFPPFCERTNQSVCMPSLSSFAYHVEDLSNAKLILRGLRIWDVDLYSGDLALDVSVRFVSDPILRDGYIPLHRFQECIDDPLFCNVKRYPARVVVGSINYYCARPRTAYGPEVDEKCVQSKDCLNCARSTSDVIGSVPYLPSDPSLRINLTSFVLADGHIEGEFFQFDMAYEIMEQFSDAVLERGVVSLSFTCESTCSTKGSSVAGLYSIHGSMSASAGVSKTSTGRKFDWYGASPLNVSGTYVYQSEADIPLMRLTLISSTIPIYAATVSASFGNISLPMNRVQLTTDTLQLKTLYGRIDQINMALSQIEFQVPAGSMPYMNTMSGVNSLYGDAQCDLKVVIDDSRYMTATLSSDSLKEMGKPVTSSGASYQIPGMSQPSNFSFNTIIVAVNNGPAIQGLSELTVLEDVPYSLNLTLLDVDAADRLRGSNVPQGGADVKIELKSVHGTFRFPSAVANSATFVEPLSAVCKSPLSCMMGNGFGPCCNTLPDFIFTMQEYLSLDSRCTGCLQQEALKLASSSGVQNCTFFSSIAVAKSALSRIQYQGNPHYNEKGADFGQYYNANGCPSQQLPVSTILNVEKISITVDDIGNTGCVGNISKTIKKIIAAHVSPVPNDPFIVLLENGVNICEGCRITTSCGDTCPFNVNPVVKTLEDVPVKFSPDFSFQVQSPDSQDNDFGSQTFILRLEVNYGVLASSSSNIGRSIVMRGSLCNLNLALQTLVYTPDNHFNSEFGMPEILQLKAGKIIAGVEKYVSSLNATIKVIAINNVPTVTVYESSIPILSEEYFDINVVSPSDSLYQGCLQGGKACLNILDFDSCEMKYRAAGAVPSSISDVHLSLGNICANSSIPGNIAVTFTVSYGNLWFFSKLSTESWPPGPDVSPPESAGKGMQVLRIEQPLAWFRGGILRYYLPSDLKRVDRVSISADDLGNTGLRTKSGFCCCMNETCPTCSSTCNLFFDARLCETSGNVCRGEIPVQIPGFAVTILCFSAFASLFAVIHAFFIRSTGIEKPTSLSMKNQAFPSSSFNEKNRGDVLEIGRPETVLAI
eukprot:CAMPEP_0172160662 /NCGR_PEP_ID=MMETSP1050-20130122/5681_1 /TAXON_ID=233186 /ORGANISM="Cryptomonas curvata, Strain CCAP979/52" /LENGTH=1190 /DNA_ID=CAMNT_0012830447 /DNA_START=512 /DNA_END=4084 /DNA_ORIENTATION=+